jgi:hypothetical protein
VDVRDAPSRSGNADDEAGRSEAGAVGDRAFEDEVGSESCREEYQGGLRKIIDTKSEDGGIVVFWVRPFDRVRLCA